MKVSVVIPAYNAEKYIRQALDSLINQTYRDIEMIVVDDGSTDGTLKVVEEFCENDSRVQIIRQKNEYAGVARNKGLKHASGEYIMFLDADDVFESVMIEKLVKYAKLYEPDVIEFGYWRFSKSRSIRRPVRNLTKKNNYLCSNIEIKDRIFQITRSLPWDKFIKLDFVKRLDLWFQNTRVNNDMYFNRVLMTEASKILFINKRFVNYRINNSLSLQGGINKNPTDFITAEAKIINELIKRDTLEIYRESLIEAVINDFILHLKKIHSFGELEDILIAAQQSGIFELLELTKDTKQICANEYPETWRALISYDAKECLCSLYRESCSYMVSKKSPEYLIGNKITRLFRMNI